METSLPDAGPRRAWAEFLFSRVIVFVVSRTHYGDVHGYFESVSRFVEKGSPYGEDGFGYPALAFLFVALPRLFGLAAFDLYYPFYRAQCFAVDVLLFWVLSRRSSRPALVVYIVCTALLASLLYHRLDIVLGCLLVIALALEARGAWRLASVALGASIAFKVIPLLLLPAWLAWTWRRSLKDAFAAAGLVALGAGAPLALACGLWGQDALLFMGVHAARGVQIESSWASLQMLLTPFGLGAEAYFEAGSHNLTSPIEDALTAASHVLAAAASLWGGVLAARLARRGRPLVLAAASTLGALIIASKVFSPQFLLFFLPALAWSFDAMNSTLRRLAMALSVLVCALTTWVYPYHEKDLLALSPVATAPLVARNALLALLVALLQVHAWRCGRAGSGAQGLGSPAAEPSALEGSEP